MKKRRKRRKPRNPGHNHDTVVENWKQYAKRHDEDDNYFYLRSLKFDDHGFKPDELAANLHQQAFQIVDCTRCANCCRTMTIVFSDEDIERISQHLNMTTQEFIDKYLELELELEDDYDPKGYYKARQQPCPFLGDDNLCTIYDVRPTDCREYPHTDKPGFTTRTSMTAGNTLVCPAVYWIVEKMKDQSRW